jgi:hypothetical protein
MTIHIEKQNINNIYIYQRGGTSAKRYQLSRSHYSIHSAFPWSFGGLNQCCNVPRDSMQEKMLSGNLMARYPCRSAHVSML